LAPYFGMLVPRGITTFILHFNLSRIYHLFIITIAIRKTTKDLIMVMGSLYSACIFLGVNNSSSVQPVVSVERTVYYRERAARMYSSLPYAIAQVISSFLCAYLLF
jgi:ABC-2 type transporter